MRAGQAPPTVPLFQRGADGTAVGQTGGSLWPQADADPRQPRNGRRHVADWYGHRAVAAGGAAPAGRPARRLCVGSTILVAAQTPKAQTGWALGVLSSGIMAGNVVGPLLGGVLPPLIGIRHTFWLTGAVIFLAFLATTFLLKEAPLPAKKAAAGEGDEPEASINRPVVRLMWLSGMLLIFANMSIEPIITLYIAQFVHGDHAVTVTAGLVMAAARWAAFSPRRALAGWPHRTCARADLWPAGLRAAADSAGIY